MKRTAVIALIALLFYNAFGYYLLYLYGSRQARITTLDAIPECAMQVAKFKIALYASLPDTDFDYIDEERTIEDKTYHVVKQRIKDDSLEIYYLRNFRQENLRASVNEIIRNQNAPSPAHSAPLKDLLKSFLKDYLPNPPAVATDIIALPMEESVLLISPENSWRVVFLPIFSPPPERA